MKVWIGPFAIGVFVLGLLLTLTLRPPDSGFVTAVFPFSYSPEQSLAAAIDGEGLALADSGPLDNMITVFSAEPGLPARLSARGALLVINGKLLSSCSPGEISGRP